MSEVILMCGSRSWRDVAAVMREVADLRADAVVITGGAGGADALADKYASARHIHVAKIYPFWGTGRDAGIKRNVAMLNLKPDRVIAFWDGESKGTKHTIDEAQRRGIPTKIVSPVQAVLSFGQGVVE